MRVITRLGITGIIAFLIAICIQAGNTGPFAGYAQGPVHLYQFYVISILDDGNAQS